MYVLIICVVTEAVICWHLRKSWGQMSAESGLCLWGTERTAFIAETQLKKSQRRILGLNLQTGKAKQTATASHIHLSLKLVIPPPGVSE